MRRSMGMPRRAVWVLLPLAVYLVLGGAAAVLATASGESTQGDQVIWLIFAPYVAIGALITAGHPRNAVGWLLTATGLVFVVSFFAEQYAVFGLVTAPGSLPLTGVAAWLSFSSWIGVLGSLLFVVLLFPNGRPASPRWRPVVWGSGALLAVVGLVFALGPAADDRHPQITNPLAVEALRPIWVWVEESFWIYLVLLVLAVASVAGRYRRARGVERQQMKWAVAGFAFAATLLAVSAQTDGWFADVGWMAGVMSIPAALGVAILRYRLYDIDLLIRRTLIYGALTTSLGLVYWCGVLLLQQLLRPLTAGSDLAIVGSTLAVAALFQPARRRIQDVVDRRFYRRKYDAQMTLESFGARMRDQVDLDGLSAELVGVVRQTVQPASVSLWLRPTTAGRGR